jgi:Rrf2 family protein
MHFPNNVDSNIGVEEISARARIPQHFTRKMFQVLARKGILAAVPGPRGGYRLARRPDQVSLLDIIEIIDGGDPLDACVLGLPVCDNRSPCALHDAWSKAKKSLLPDFRNTSISDLRKSQEKDRLIRTREPRRQKRRK